MKILINNRNELIELFELYKERNACIHSNYDEWSKADMKFVEELKLIAKVKGTNELKTNTNYWGKGSPIEIDKYPYSSCEIYICDKCNCKFFYYIEHGGHTSEKRLRRIHKKAIIDKTKEYYLNLAIPKSILEFHQIVKLDLNFPEFYGENWDAFWDTITGAVEMPSKVTFYNYSIFLKNWKEKAEPLKSIIEDYNKKAEKEIKLIAGTISLI